MFDCETNNSNNQTELDTGEQPYKKIKLQTEVEAGNDSVIKNESGQVIYDPNCEDCKKTYEDPTQEQLVMYLHAYKYQVKDVANTRIVVGLSTEPGNLNYSQQ